MKNSLNKIIFIVAITIITGATAFYILQTDSDNNETSTVKTDSIVKVSDTKNITTQKTVDDTTIAKHTIIIDNVKDPRQLQQILQILENYSAENQINDINIKCEETPKNSLIKK